MIDAIELLQKEATQNQYIFNFVLMNIIFLLCYIFRNDRKNHTITWLLVLVFCLYAYWDTDYFSFRSEIYSPHSKDFRDPLYYYLSLISFNSYTLLRVFVWGTGLLLYKKTIENLNISSNIAIYIFAVFFLLTFSYARVSLGMALYFYGLSYLIKPNEYNRNWSIIWGLIFIGCSYFGHRSMIALIALTPLAFIKLNRKNFVLIIIAGLVLGGLSATLLSGLLSGSLSLTDELGGAGKAAEQYANIEIEMEYNWKFALMRNLRFYSFYLACFYIAWKVAFSKQASSISPEIKRLSTVCIGILLFALSFLTLPTWGADIIGYRYLYMLGIPLCVVISYFATNKLSRPRTILFLLMLAFLYSEGFIFGKIFFS